MKKQCEYINITADLLAEGRSLAVLILVLGDWRVFTNELMQPALRAQRYVSYVSISPFLIERFLIRTAPLHFLPSPSPPF
jgi:hypothetical protein